MSRSNVSQTTDPLNPIAETVEEVAEVSSMAKPTLDVAGMRPEDLQLAHELCTPLTALKSAIEILCQAALPEDTQRMALIAQRNVERMAVIIEAMLSKRTIRS
jgi:signal transduction histidine kinase